MFIGDKIRSWVASTEMASDTGSGVTPNDEYVNQKRMGMYVGLVAFLLAPVMFLKWLLFDGCFYDSISHFYYSRYTGDMLVGALVFIAVFLFAYNGRFKVEYWMAKFAGVGALFIAWFPVSGTGCENRAEIAGRAFVRFGTDAQNALVDNIVIASERNPYAGAFQLFDNWIELPLIGAVQVDTFHFTGAALLFGTLTFFCFFVFTIPRPGEVNERGLLREGKKNRNKLYTLCGWCMFLAILVIAAHSLKLIPTSWWNGNNVMYWMEVIILTFFAIAWWTKGRFDFWKESNIGNYFERKFIDIEAKSHATERGSASERGI